jgi:hypothetical protein
LVVGQEPAILSPSVASVFVGPGERGRNGHLAIAADGAGSRPLLLLPRSRSAEKAREPAEAVTELEAAIHDLGAPTNLDLRDPRFVFAGAPRYLRGVWPI